MPPTRILLSLPAGVALRRAGQRTAVLVSLAAWPITAAAADPATASGETGDTPGGSLLCAVLTVLLGLVLLYGAVLAHRWMTSSAPRRSSPLPVLIPAAEGQGPFDFRLLDAVELPADITVYFIKLGRRVILLAARDQSLVSLGDFPLAWALGDETEEDAPALRPGPGPATAPAPGGLLSAARGRDQRQWEEQRRALIQALQQEEA